MVEAVGLQVSRSTMEWGRHALHVSRA